MKLHKSNRPLGTEAEQLEPQTVDSSHPEEIQPMTQEPSASPSADADGDAPELPPESPRAMPATPSESLKKAALRRHVGRLIEHGAAPFNFDKSASMSYFVKLDVGGKEELIWGKDLPLALEQVQLGDYVQLDFMGATPVEVSVPILDAQGNKTGRFEPKVTNRNSWQAASISKERAEALLKELEPSPTPLKSFAPSIATNTTSPSPQGASPASKPGNGSSGPGARRGGGAHAQTAQTPQSQAEPAQRVGQQSQNLFSSLLGSLFSGGAMISSLFQAPSQRARQARENQHDMLMQSMRHSANRVAATAQALETGALSSVLDKMKASGVSLDEIVKGGHPELRQEYEAAMAPHQAKLRQQMEDLAFYANAAAKSAKETGVNIEPEVNQIMDDLDVRTENIATQDKDGKLEKLSEGFQKIMEMVAKVIRELFDRFSPSR